MATTDILIIGAGSSGCRLVKTYQERNKNKPCIYSFLDHPDKATEPVMNLELLFKDAPACTIIVAGLGGDSGSTFAPEIARHAKQHSRVFAVITLPFPHAKQRRERAMDALARLAEHAEALFVTDLGKVLETVPANAHTDDIMRDVNQKIFDTLYILYEAHQTDRSFSVDAVKERLPQGFMDAKEKSAVEKTIHWKTTKLRREIAELSARFDAGSAGSCKECQEALGKLADECDQIDDPEEKQKTAELISDVYYKLAERCMDSLDIFGSLYCMVDCRRLHEMVPSSEHTALQLLQCMTGLLYVKNAHREDGMVDEFMDEVFELADLFPENISIQRQAGVCIQNLIALCGGFDAPFRLAYNAANRMESVADRFPEDSDLQNVYAHILISACFFAKQTGNKERLLHFLMKLQHLMIEREEPLDVVTIWDHFEKLGLK